MLLNKNIFKEKKFFEKILITIKTLNPEKSFYFYFATFLIVIFSIFSINIFIKNNLTNIKPKYKENLNIYSSEKILNILPFYSNNKTENIISNLTFAGILKYNTNNEGLEKYKLDLAESVDNTDKLNIKIKLKNNIYFSDGKEITTDDIIYSYKMMQDFEIDNKDRAKYEGLTFEKIDDKNFVVNLKKEYSEIEKLLTLGIVEKNYLINNKDVSTILFDEKDLKNIPTSGEYRITDLSLKDNDIIELNLKNNDNYYNLSYFRKVNFYLEKISDDKNTVENYFNSKNIDLSLQNFNSLNTVKNDSKDTNTDWIKREYTTPITNILFLNPNKNQIFAKKENREFLYNIVDRYFIVNNILNGSASLTYDIFPGSLKNSSSTNINETSFSSSTDLSVTFLNTETNQKIFEYLFNAFSKYNINLKANSLDQESLQNSIKNRDYELLLTNLNIEDSTSLYSFFHSSQKNAPGLNITNYASSDFDKNIETLRKTNDKQEKEKAIQNLKDEFYKEYPFIPLYSKNNTIIIQKDLKIETEKYLENEKYLLDNIGNSYKETEYVYKFLERFKNQIIKINKLIN